MSDNILTAGDAINIKRTNGALQTAIISAIDYESLCVKVEWLENKETKGKEIHFNNVVSLNPNVSLIKPQLEANHSSYESIEDKTAHLKQGKAARVQSARTRSTVRRDNNLRYVLTRVELIF